MRLRDYKDLSKRVFQLQDILKDLEKSFNQIEIMQDIRNIKTEIEMFKLVLDEVIQRLIKEK